MGELAARLAVVAVGVVLLLSVAMVIVSPGLAERFLFYPDPEDPGPLPELEGVPVRTVTLTTSDGLEIRSWWYEVGTDAPAILLLHGNAGHVGARLPLARGFVARGISVFLLEYRGYGGNPGRPTLEGTVRDARAGLDHLSSVVGSRRIVVFGRSVGGAIGMQALENRQVAGVMLEATFTSLEEIARSVYPVLPGFVFRRLRGHLDTRTALAEQDRPVLVIHGREDRIVPLAMGRELYRAAREPKEWYAVDGAGHNDPFAVAGDAYFDRLVAFVREVAAGPAQRSDAGGASDARQAP